VNFVRVRSKEPEAGISMSSAHAALRPTASTKLSSAILAQDLGYGQTDVFMKSLEEVSRPLNAYARVILAPGF
jgi:hypothetical protein